MFSKLLIVKDNRDHISAIVHELAKVWSIHMGKENLSVFGIYDHDEFDGAFSCDFVLFLLNNETLSYENQVPKWLCKLGYYDRPTKNKFKYLVVREFRPSSEQIHIADGIASFWTENENERKPNERNIDAKLVIDVDEISRVLKWWPRVIQHTFKTRNAMCKVHVETDENSLFDGSEVELKVERTREDINDFLAKFNALSKISDGSKSHQLFIIGDPSKFFDTHTHLRQEKINGSKIMLILVGENKHHAELIKISTSHMFLSNMVFDVLQVMVDLGIVGERKALKKTRTVNQVKDPIIETWCRKVTWSIKDPAVVLSDPGYVSVQVKNKINGKWEECASKEASVSTDVVIIRSTQDDDEFQVMFEDAKTGSLSTPICIKHLTRHQCKSIINRIILFLIIPIVLKCHLEALLMMVAIFPLGFYLLYKICTKKENSVNCSVTCVVAMVFAMIFDIMLMCTVEGVRKFIDDGTYIGLLVGNIANLFLNLGTFGYLFCQKNLF